MKFNKEIKDIIVKRILITLGILTVTRLGTFFPIPGINILDLILYIKTHFVAQRLVNTFAGNKLFVLGLFNLSIIPYINASILVQLIVVFSPKFAKLQKEGDLEGKRAIARLTRLITLIIALFQSLSLALYLRQVLFNWRLELAFEIIIWLTAGAMIVLWLSELITDYGLGNGTSLIVYTNIIAASFPNFIKSIFTENISIGSKFLVALLMFVLLYGIVLLQEGVFKIPLISSKQLNQGSLQDVPNYLPLRLNQAGVMPIILTSTILVIPNYLTNVGLFPRLGIFESLKFVYWIVYFGLIILSSSFYSKIVLNPKDLSDQFQKMAVTIPGIRPGIYTTFYLKQVMNRVTFVGATMLAMLVTIPNFIESTLNITNGLSTTSLLIVAGVVLDLNREISDIYYSNVYNDMYQ